MSWSIVWCHSAKPFFHSTIINYKSLTNIALISIYVLHNHKSCHTSHNYHRHEITRIASRPHLHPYPNLNPSSHRHPPQSLPHAPHRITPPHSSNNKPPHLVHLVGEAFLEKLIAMCRRGQRAPKSKIQGVNVRSKSNFFIKIWRLLSQ